MDEKTNLTFLPTATIVLCPLGSQSAAKPKARQDIVCWHCGYPFDWEPCLMPRSYNRIEKTYTGVGNFCTWNCCQEYSSTHNRSGRSGSRILIALITTRLQRQMNPSHYQKGYIPLQSIPPRNMLEMYGGSMPIESFRHGCMKFNGELCGLPDVFSNLRDSVVPAHFKEEADRLVLQEIYTTDRDVPKTRMEGCDEDPGVFPHNSSSPASATKRKRGKNFVKTESLLEKAKKRTNTARDLRDELAKRWDGGNEPPPVSNNGTSLLRSMGITIRRG